MKIFIITLTLLSQSLLSDAFVARTGSRAPATWSSPSFLASSHDKATGSADNTMDDFPDPNEVSDEKIRSLFMLFNNALATRNPKLVSRRYSKDAVLLPSSNGDAIMDAEGIEEYYSEYLLKKPQKKIIEGRIMKFKGWAQDAGICEITYQSDGRQQHVKARYSFAYVWESKQWKILQHHMSILGASKASSDSPSAPTAGSMTTDRVQNMFQLLEDAIDIGDADLVSKRFTADGLLLPMDVYETPKRGQDEIRDYFDQFLRDYPVISDVERTQIMIDPSAAQSWAKDIGTLLVTFGTDESSLHARYSLDYVLDKDGVWRILQFSISPLPKEWDSLRASRAKYDATVAAPSLVLQTNQPSNVTEADVHKWFDDWNTAMASCDAMTVADLYSPHAVMMTTLSEAPRSTPQEILEFYQMFLWNRPQAKVVQSLVSLSSNWCKNVGVLEYTLKDSDGNVRQNNVKERFSFLYVQDENNDWKIAHHHSAIIPEVLQATSQVIDGDSENLYFQ